MFDFKTEPIFEFEKDKSCPECGEQVDRIARVWIDGREVIYCPHCVDDLARQVDDFLESISIFQDEM